jgi:hypothetical protein
LHNSASEKYWFWQRNGELEAQQLIQILYYKIIKILILKSTTKLMWEDQEVPGIQSYQDNCASS